MRTFLLLITAVLARASGSSHEEEKPAEKTKNVGNRPIFSPRMDYDEWTPLGHGDPLKNDPTYDYVPPVLDRVHYWMDPSKRTPDPPLPNSDVLVLGTHTEVPTTTPTASSRLGSMSLLDPFLKFMDASKASLGFTTATNYFRPTQSPPYFHLTHQKPSHYAPATINPTELMPPPQIKVQALQRPPYTMLMPPPPPPQSTTEVPVTSLATSTRTTTTSVDLSSSTETYNETSTQPTKATETTIIAHLENLYKPVAITMPESISNETNELPPTTPIPQPMQEESLPIISLFNGQSNHLQYQELKPPSGVMVPPPKKHNEYYGFLPTTVRTTTTLRSLTTDPMFKHYNQPSEPARGPFYLIIQGHSKVKTYGASKNKVKSVSSNEINFDEIKSKNFEDFQESRRRERKLLISDTETEVIEGHPTIELRASFEAKELNVPGGENKMKDLEVAFPQSDGGRSKKRILQTERRKRFISRRLLASTTEDSLDEQQLNLESLIALNEDYNSEDVINLLLKEEGQGSGFGGLVSSLLSRSIKSGEDI